MPPQIIKAPCAGACKGRTNHRILFVEKDEYSTEDYIGGDEYRIIKCCGCDTISFQKVHWDADDLDYDGEPIERYEHFPFPENGREPITDCFVTVPRKVRKIYLESIHARNHGQHILAGMGVRAVVEALCIHKKCKKRSLEKSIDALKEAGVLTEAQAGYLHLNRFFGNEAAHELNEAPLKEIDAALDIIDGILTMTYKLPEYAERLEQYKKEKPSNASTPAKMAKSKKVGKTGSRLA